MTPRTSRTLALGFAGLGLVGALAGCSTATSPTTGSGGSGGGSSAGESVTGSSVSGPYKDGDYKEDGSYLSPAGEQSVTVELTLSGDKVTQVTVTPHATDPTAKGYQQMFVGGISDVVVGKDLDALKVSRVAGSSLTSGGFNKAIDAIKTDAKA